jgi:4-hydroxy-tetrahydrodipicolinate synthase
MQFEGIYTPLVTPYHDDFSLNEAALVETVEYLIAAGVHGIVVAGSTGEYYAQTPEERLEMMTRCAGLINGRVPMVTGTGAIRTEDSIMYAKAAKAAGADALLVATPPYAYPTGREIALHALAVDRAANLPVMLYNYPGRDVGRHGRGVFGPFGPLSQLLWNQGKFWRHQPIAHASARLPAYRLVLRYG